MKKKVPDQTKEIRITIALTQKEITALYIGANNLVLYLQRCGNGIDSSLIESAQGLRNYVESFNTGDTESDAYTTLNLSESHILSDTFFHQ